MAILRVIRPISNRILIDALLKYSKNEFGVEFSKLITGTRTRNPYVNRQLKIGFIKVRQFLKAENKFSRNR